MARFFIPLGVIAASAPRGVAGAQNLLHEEEELGPGWVATHPNLMIFTTNSGTMMVITIIVPIMMVNTITKALWPEFLSRWG